MTFTLQEVHFLRQSTEAVNIKASDAPLVAGLITKLDKEFERLAAKAEKENAAAEAKAKS